MQTGEVNRRLLARPRRYAAPVGAGSTVMEEEVIRVEGLRVRYPAAAPEAVAGIDFAVAAGEVFGLLGPNGAGKSTTQRVLTGQHRQYAGVVEVLGEPVVGWGRALYERIGVGFELPAYFPKLTARENLAALAALYRRPADRPEQALAIVGCWASCRPHCE